MKLAGKTALITGSTSGIGLAIARAFAAEGASVMINGFGDAAEIEAIRAELASSSGAAALHDGADLGKVEQIEAMVARCTSEIGAPDILVNNAGIQFVSPVADFPTEKWEQSRLNLTGFPHHPLARRSAPRVGGYHQTPVGHSSSSPQQSAYVAASMASPASPRPSLETAATLTANAFRRAMSGPPWSKNQIPERLPLSASPATMSSTTCRARAPTKRFVTPENRRLAWTVGRRRRSSPVQLAMDCAGRP